MSLGWKVVIDALAAPLSMRTSIMLSSLLSRKLQTFATKTPIIKTIWLDLQHHREQAARSHRREQARGEMRRWADMFRQATFGLMISDGASDLMTDINPALVAMLRKPAAAFIGRSVVELYPPEERERIEAMLRACDAAGFVNFISEYRLDDGVVLPVQVHTTSVRGPDGSVQYRITFVNDISAQLRSEQAQLAAQTTARLAIAAANLGTWVSHPQTGEAEFDECSKSLFGLAADAPVPRDIFITAIHPHDRARVPPQREISPGCSDYSEEFRIVGIENGRERAIALRGSATFENGVCTRIVGVMSDVSERVARQKIDDLRIRHDAAVGASQSKSRFLAAASHDLRQPLHAIGLFLGVLRSGPSPAQLEIVIDNLSAAVASMHRMFDGLLDVVRLDAGMLTAQPRTFPLQTIFSALHATFEAAARAKGLRLVVHPTPIMMLSDPGLLDSALQNLVSNAVNYTSFGEIVVEARDMPDHVGIAVRDTGKGIAADRLEDIFDEFVRLEHNDGSHIGMGLGLAIVRRQATLLGGVLGVRSELGTGSVFTLTLPSLAYAPTEYDQASKPVRASLSGKRVLLVEDHKLVLAGLVMKVQTWGAQPLPAASADEAMALLVSMMPDRPDAAIVDLDLSGPISGLMLLQQIKLKFGRALPAVIVTGSTTKQAMADLQSSGYRWLTKPTEAEALKIVVSECLGAALAQDAVGASAFDEGGTPQQSFEKSVP